MTVETMGRTWAVRETLPATDARFFASMQVLHPGFSPVHFDLSRGRAQRILGLGDSFGTYGGRRNYYQLLLEHLLHATSAPMKLINISIPMCDLKEEQVLLQRYGMRFAPDVVVHGVFVGNDLQPIREGTRVHFQSLMFENVPWVIWDARTWVVFRWIHAAWIHGLDRSRLAGEIRRGRTETWGLSTEMYHQVLDRYLGHFVSTYRLSSEWSSVQETVREIHADVTRHGATYVMVVLPDIVQVEDYYQTLMVQRQDGKMRDYDFDLPQTLLQEFGEREGFPVIDLLPAFRKAGRSGGLYIAYDAHWSDQGNVLAAKIISDELLKRGLVSPQRRDVP